MTKDWLLTSQDPQQVEQLQRDAEIPAIVAQLLVSRGMDNLQQVSEFLNPKLTGLRDPEQLPGATEAAEKILQAIAEKKRIVIFGDYDADGVTGHFGIVSLPENATCRCWLLCAEPNE